MWVPWQGVGWRVERKLDQRYNRAMDNQNDDTDAAQDTGSIDDDPFAVFTEWSGPEDEEAYADL